ncbi:hypothetical protein SAMN05444392_11914 [Seinonella peptonophila]|uniref:Uncharacterized protein n=1 Tax=Seinonella peptonophila TaxID=112248 RepID=A0A1M5B7C3_9BACL|nr:hypothetical protein [Seinonella peptonophila]SHF38379.1 hypothetical protein SAMN05444392_11914 [Seinonella peptonophila]
MKINEGMLLESKSVRVTMMGKTEVLDKVKDLVFLPNTKLMTTEQVAGFYEVSKKSINSLTFDHKNELLSDGYTVYSGEQLNSLKKSSHIKTRARSLALSLAVQSSSRYALTRL